MLQGIFFTTAFFVPFYRATPTYNFSTNPPLPQQSKREYVFLADLVTLLDIPTALLFKFKINPCCRQNVKTIHTNTRFIRHVHVESPQHLFVMIRVIWEEKKPNQWASLVKYCHNILLINQMLLSKINIKQNHLENYFHKHGSQMQLINWR